MCCRSELPRSVAASQTTACRHFESCWGHVGSMFHTGVCEKNALRHKGRYIAICVPTRRIHTEMRAAIYRSLCGRAFFRRHRYVRLHCLNISISAEIVKNQSPKPYDSAGYCWSNTLIVIIKEKSRPDNGWALLGHLGTVGALSWEHLEAAGPSSGQSLSAKYGMKCIPLYNPLLWSIHPLIIIIIIIA